MKEAIHPKYVDAKVVCACGNTFMTRSTKPEIRLEICSGCHPFFTGKQKLVDTAGRVERFQKRFSKTEGKTVRTKVAKTRKVAPKKAKGTILSTSPKRSAAAAKKKETKETKETKKEK